MFGDNLSLFELNECTHESHDPNGEKNSTINDGRGETA
jgi:hypothetical protein